MKKKLGDWVVDMPAECDDCIGDIMGVCDKCGKEIQEYLEGRDIG